MQGLKKNKRDLNGSRTRLPQFRPAVFLVRLDGWFTFRQCKLKSHVRIDVTVRNVMHNLPYGPASGAIRSIELACGKPSHRRPQLGRRLLDVINELVSLLLRSSVKRELSNRITQITHFRL